MWKRHNELGKPLTRLAAKQKDATGAIVAYATYPSGVLALRFLHASFVMLGITCEHTSSLALSFNYFPFSVPPNRDLSTIRLAQECFQRFIVRCRFSPNLSFISPSLAQRN